jgi:hypothetical protein
MMLVCIHYSIGKNFSFFFLVHSPHLMMMTTTTITTIKFFIVGEREREREATREVGRYQAEEVW